MIESKSLRHAAARGLRIALIAIPLIALLLVPAFIASTQPRFFGLPPIMWWILLWVVLSPVCLLAIERMRGK